MKKRFVTAVITACLALCAAVWPQPDTREERPAPIPTHAATAPKTDAVTTAEKKNTETPRAEPFLLLQAVVSQDVLRNKFCFVPDLGKYDRIYTDKYLCEKWNITDDEWKYIDSRIK